MKECECPRGAWDEHLTMCKLWKPLWMRERDRKVRERGRVAEKELTR